MISANHKCLFFILLIVGIFRGYQCIGSDEENVGSDEENVDSGIGQGWEIVSGHEIEEDSLSKGNEKEMYPGRRESKMYPVKEKKTGGKPKTSRELVSKGNEKEMYPGRRESKMYPVKEKKTGGKPKTMRGLEIKEDFLKKENSERKVKEEKTGDHTVSYLKMFLESKTLLEAFDIAYKYLTKKSFKSDILKIAIDHYYNIGETIKNHILTEKFFQLYFEEKYDYASYVQFLTDFNTAYYNLTIDDFDDDPKADIYNSILKLVTKKLEKIDVNVASIHLMNFEEFNEQ